MTALRVGVIGASRRRNGTGEFIARFFAEAGAQLVAVAGTSQASADEAAERLRLRGAGSPIGAASVRDLFEHSLDAVAICSPLQCHEEHLELALDAGVHVFCEKPLMWDAGQPMLPRTRALLDRFTAGRRVLHLNTQWVEALPAFRELHPLSIPPRSFVMEMSPPVRGEAMLPEVLPHPVSLLVTLGATGPVSQIEASWSPDADRLDFRFLAQTAGPDPIDVQCRFRETPTQPRPMAFAIDGHRVDRDIDLATYAMRLRAEDGRATDITDPVRLAVGRFLDRVRRNDYHGQTAPICANVQMVDELAAALVKAIEHRF